MAYNIGMPNLLTPTRVETRRDSCALVKDPSSIRDRLVPAYLGSLGHVGSTPVPSFQSIDIRVSMGMKSLCFRNWNESRGKFCDSEWDAQQNSEKHPLQVCGVPSCTPSLYTYNDLNTCSNSVDNPKCILYIRHKSYTTELISKSYFNI